MPATTQSNQAWNDVVRHRFDLNHGSPTTATTTAATTIYTPASPYAPRLRWFGMKAANANTMSTLVHLFIGATEIYRWEMSAGDLFSHTGIREGAAGDLITVTMSVAQTIYCNVDCEDF